MELVRHRPGPWLMILLALFAGSSARAGHENWYEIRPKLVEILRLILVVERSSEYDFTQLDAALAAAGTANGLDGFELYRRWPEVDVLEEAVRAISDRPAVLLSALAARTKHSGTAAELLRRALVHRRRQAGPGEPTLESLYLGLAKRINEGSGYLQGEDTKVLERVLTLMKERGAPPEQMAEVWYLLANSRSHLGFAPSGPDAQRRVRLLRQAIEVWKPSQDKGGMRGDWEKRRRLADAQNCLGRILLATDQLEDAHATLEAIDLEAPPHTHRRDTTAEEDADSFLKFIIDAFEEKGRPDLANHYRIKQLGLAEARMDSAIAEAVGIGVLIARSRLARDELGEARAAARLATDREALIQDPASRSIHPLDALAQVELEAGRLGEAEAHYRKLIARLEGGEDRFHLATALHDLAVVRKLGKDLDGAHALLGRAVILADETDRGGMVHLTILEYLAEVEDARGRKEQADEWRGKLAGLKADQGEAAPEPSPAAER